MMIPVAIPPMNYREEEDGSLVPPEDDDELSRQNSDSEDSE